MSECWAPIKDVAAEMGWTRVRPTATTNEWRPNFQNEIGLAGIISGCRLHRANVPLGRCQSAAPEDQIRRISVRPGSLSSFPGDPGGGQRGWTIAFLGASAP